MVEDRTIDLKCGPILGIRQRDEKWVKIRTNDW